MKTGNPAEIARLNNLFGRELGRNLNAEPIFSWRWSEDMFWPSFPTGRTVTKERFFDIPLVGGGVEKGCIEEAVPEYAQDRQVRLLDTWYIAKWLTPEELIVGGLIGHGMGWQGGQKPSDEQLREAWKRQFPGADFPAQGWRVPTDAHLPRSPQESKVPNEADTLHFIRCIREQTSMRFDERLKDMLAYEDRGEAEKDRVIQDMVRDSFPAFLNPNIGKRGGFVSFPWARRG
ncbi:MAG: hypothetical protein RIR25_613 [Verrucomicrobiota bacterium]